MKKQNYRVLRKIASGSTSMIYEAIQISLDRKVIIKKLHPHLTSDPDFINRFEMEAKTAASLNHENIVRIIDSGKQNSTYYIVMEYIEGISLRTLMDRRHPLEEDISMLIAHGICYGLTHAHRHGIIHRDIKPANIMISREGVVKITDFGLAKLIRGQVSQTQSGSLLGTPLYMSPEQAIGDNVDVRSDIFSLGSICYEMVTGKKPFNGNNYASVIQSIISRPIKELSRSLKGSPEIGPIIMKALQRNPERRFRSTADMASGIEQTLGRERILSARDLLKSYVYEERTVTPLRRRPKRRAGRTLLRVAAALVICAGIIALSLNPHQIKTVYRNINSGSGTAGADNGLRAGMEGNSGFGFIEVRPEKEQLPDSAGSRKEEAKEPSRERAEEPDTSRSEPAVPDTATAEDQKKDSSSSAAAEEKKSESGLLDIHVKPEAAIFIDGKQRIFGNHLGPMPLEPGKHSLLIQRAGYENYTEVLRITGDELSRRRIRLIEVKGRIDITTTPGAELYIDDEFIAVTPLKSPVVIESGTHRVKLVKEGFRTWENMVDVQPRDTLKLSVTLVRE
ncbi:MAG: protein kinase [Candidatus Latescibacteria bacterium]|nr:protein kinase [bacterium]MBD3424375.1 protein kinase [Candidatus Latescibacterota bacterium]